jgi:hypothetical protein
MPLISSPKLFSHLALNLQRYSNSKSEETDSFLAYLKHCWGVMVRTCSWPPNDGFLFLWIELQGEVHILFCTSWIMTTWKFRYGNLRNFYKLKLNPIRKYFRLTIGTLGELLDHTKKKFFRIFRTLFFKDTADGHILIQEFFQINRVASTVSVIYSEIRLNFCSSAYFLWIFSLNCRLTINVLYIYKTFYIPTV